MIELIADAARTVLAYPSVPHVRRHGPQGYADYRTYKPWLRDEFTFRCVYCLTREVWYPNGHEEFSVEHIAAQSIAPDRSGEYDNLLYACSSCNRNRQDTELPISPAVQPLSEHLRINSDGTVEALTSEGRALIKACHLNRPLLKCFRERLLMLIGSLAKRPAAEAETVICHLLGFPDDLPDLASKRPPGGNTLPNGIAQSYYERRKRGELPSVY